MKKAKRKQKQTTSKPTSQKRKTKLKKTSSLLKSSKQSSKPRKVVKKPLPTRALNTTLYAWVEARNANYARKLGAKLFGSYSAYVNALIANDRGVKPRLGFWKSPGEATANRLSR